MIEPSKHDRRTPRILATCICYLLAAVSIAGAQPDRSKPASPPVLSLDATMHYALENNPALAAARQQRGIAAAKVVIADTYPFNPSLENRFQVASGPASAGITNNLPIEHILLWEVEVHHQRRYRREGAAAALSRTDWEIAAQEQALAIQVIRVYATLLYRQEKQQLVGETLRFNERLVSDVRQLVNAGKLRNADLIVAQTEVTDTQDLVSQGQESLVAARQDLFRVMGIVDAGFQVEGPLESPEEKWDAAVLTDLAQARRADLQAKRLAVAEAAANLKLAIANRRGNPVVGPAFTYDPSKVSAIGIQVNVPIPFPNRHRGEILQSEAEQAQAVLALRQAEINVRQDVASCSPAWTPHKNVPS